jgi:hypothetical protein
MKKYLTGILAIMLAVSFSAFTNTETSKKTLYYWFPLDPSTGVAQSVMTLVHQADDPQGCDELHTANPYCEGAYNSFTGTGPYTPSGSRIITDHKLTP